MCKISVVSSGKRHQNERKLFIGERYFKVNPLKMKARQSIWRNKLDFYYVPDYKNLKSQWKTIYLETIEHFLMQKQNESRR